jgi:predicted small lipoprotein YifL
MNFYFFNCIAFLIQKASRFSCWLLSLFTWRKKWEKIWTRTGLLVLLIGCAGCGVKGPLYLAPDYQKPLPASQAPTLVPNQQFESFDQQYELDSSKDQNQNIQPKPDFEKQELEP